MSSVRAINSTANVLQIVHDIWCPMENNILKEVFVCYGLNVWSRVFIFLFFENVKYFIGGFLRNASDRTSDTLQQVT